MRSSLHAARRARNDHLRLDESPRDEQRGMLAFEQAHRTPQAVVAADGLGQRRPWAGLHRPRARGEPHQAGEADDEDEHADGRAQRPRGHEEIGQAGPALCRYEVRPLSGLPERCERRRDRRGRVGCASSRSFTWQGDAPRRNDHLENRNRCGADDRHGENPVTDGSRSPAKQRCQRQSHRNHDRDLEDAGEQNGHLAPPFRAFSRCSAMRCSSSSDTLTPSPPRSAPTTFSTEPSKNVSTRCLSADFRAARCGTAGM